METTIQEVAAAQLSATPAVVTGATFGGKLAMALAKAQGEMTGAKKDSTNSHFKSSYADLASVLDVCREPLSKHGLAVLQFPQATGAVVTMKTMLLHESGEYLESPEVSAKAANDSPQSIGSAITYLRRYSIMAILGIAPEDDDGEAAQGRPAASQPATKPIGPTAKPAKPETADDPEAKEVQRLMVATSAEISRSNCPKELFVDWAKSKGYPVDRAKMNATQLQDALTYLQTLPNASKTA